MGVTCRTAAAGRRAVRALADWAQRFELGEPEFQILWCLRWASGDGLDQITLAKNLGCSPAQVSATVERMRVRGWITPGQQSGDRRRKLWRLSTGGSELFDLMLNAAGCLRRWELNKMPAEAADHHPRKAVA